MMGQRQIKGESERRREKERERERGSMESDQQRYSQKIN